MSLSLKLWPTQAKFFESDADVVALFTGAGYGKSEVLGAKVARNICLQDGWWEGLGPDAQYKPLDFLCGAPTSAYLIKRTIPAVKQWIDKLERATGCRIRSNSGRGKDGFYANYSHLRQECRNGVVIHFPFLQTESSAVAVDAACGFVDEVTMLAERRIWNRFSQRIRDQRAKVIQKCVVGTPETDHFIYDVFFDADGDPRELRSVDGVELKYDVFTASSYENPLLPDQWFLDIAATASDAFINMQVEGQWVRGSSGQRFAKVFDTKRHCIPMNVGPSSYGAKFYLGVDPGFSTGSWLILYKNVYKAGGRVVEEWWIVDEIVVKGMTTAQAAREIRRRGFSYKNLRKAGIDVDGKNQNRHTKQTDISVIKEVLGITPKYNGGRHKMNAEPRLREDYIDALLSRDRLKINEKLIPRSSQALGIVNALRKYAHKRVKGEDDMFEDRPTPETQRMWKHPIDALWYILQHVDRRTIQKLDLRFTKDPVARQAIYEGREI